MLLDLLEGVFLGLVAFVGDEVVDVVKVNTIFLLLLSVLGSLLLNFLLAVVPGSSGVGGGNGNLNSGYDGSGEETSYGLLAEEETGDEWGSEDEGAWSNHLSERGLS